MHVPDRQKQRREYLKKKKRAYRTVAGGSCLLLLYSVLTIICSLVSLMIFAVSMHFRELWSLFFLCPLVPAAIYCGLRFWQSCKEVKAASQHAKSIPDVPPVIPDTLPAGKILSEVRRNRYRNRIFAVSGRRRER